MKSMDECCDMMDDMMKSFSHNPYKPTMGNPNVHHVPYRIVDGAYLPHHPDDLKAATGIETEGRDYTQERAFYKEYFGKSEEVNKALNNIQENSMIFTTKPVSLIQNINEDKNLAKSIEDNEYGVSGRPSLTKSYNPEEDQDLKKSVDENLKNTHGEEFHSDADKQVVNWLTETGQIGEDQVPPMYRSPEFINANAEKSENDVDLEKAAKFPVNPAAEKSPIVPKDKKDDETRKEEKESETTPSDAAKEEESEETEKSLMEILDDAFDSLIKSDEVVELEEEISKSCDVEVREEAEEENKKFDEKFKKKVKKGMINDFFQTDNDEFAQSLLEKSKTVSRNGIPYYADGPNAGKIVGSIRGHGASAKSIARARKKGKISAKGAREGIKEASKNVKDQAEYKKKVVDRGMSASDGSIDGAKAKAARKLGSKKEGLDSKGYEKRSDDRRQKFSDKTYADRGRMSNIPDEMDRKKDGDAKKTKKNEKLKAEHGELKSKFRETQSKHMGEQDVDRKATKQAGDKKVKELKEKQANRDSGVRNKRLAMAGDPKVKQKTSEMAKLMDAENTPENRAKRSKLAKELDSLHGFGTKKSLVEDALDILKGE